jgi:hypothetical protein
MAKLLLLFGYIVWFFGYIYVLGYILPGNNEQNPSYNEQNREKRKTLKIKKKIGKIVKFLTNLCLLKSTNSDI